MGLRPIDVQGSVPEAPEIARIQRPRPAGSDSDEGAADAVADAGQGVLEADAAEEEPGESPDGGAAPWGGGGGAAADQDPDATDPGAPQDGGGEDGAGPHIDIRV